MDLTEAEDIKKGGKNTQKNYTKKNFMTQITTMDGVITHLEPDILECEVKWALGTTTVNKASGGDGIPLELFQILKDDAVLALGCQHLFSSVQLLSRVRLWHPMTCSTPGLPVHYQLPEFTQTQIGRAHV